MNWQLQDKQDRNEVFFKIKQSTPLKKLMDAYCERQGKSPDSVRFLYDGERVQPTDTPQKVKRWYDEKGIQESYMYFNSLKWRMAMLLTLWLNSLVDYSLVCKYILDCIAQIQKWRKDFMMMTKDGCG